MIPYFHFLHYRDLSAAEDNLPAAEKWIGYYLAKSENYLTKITNNFGDWLSVNGDTDPDVVNQCFFGYSALLTAKLCEILKKDEKRDTYTEIYENCRRAFRENYYKDGRDFLRYADGVRLCLRRGISEQRGNIGAASGNHPRKRRRG